LGWLLAPQIEKWNSQMLWQVVELLPVLLPAQL
jgi:hypothetical protein